MQPELREPAARNTNQRGALLIQNTVKKAAKNSKFPPTNGIFEIYDLEISQHEVHTASAPPERVLSFATGWYSASVSNGIFRHPKPEAERRHKLCHPQPSQKPRKTGALF